MKTKINAAWHHDPGHEWLVLNYSALDRVGLSEADFTPFSYTDGQRVALEGDCDAGTFFDAVHALRDVELVLGPDVVHAQSDAPIRRWRSFGKLETT